MVKIQEFLNSFCQIMTSKETSVEPDGQPERVIFTAFQIAGAHSKGVFSITEAIYNLPY